MILPGVCNDGGMSLCWRSTVAVLVGVMRIDPWGALSMVPDAWSVNCADWRSFVLIIGVPCRLRSLAVPGSWRILRVTQKAQTNQLRVAATNSPQTAPKPENLSSDKAHRNKHACALLPYEHIRHNSPMKNFVFRAGVSRGSMVWFRWVCTASCGRHMHCIVVRGDAWPMLLCPCNTRLAQQCMHYGLRVWKFWSLQEMLRQRVVFHGESNRGQASLRTTVQCMCQPQESVQTQRHQTILPHDTPAQKTK